MTTKTTEDMVGHFFMTPDGDRVIVERMGDDDARAIVRRVDGPKEGTRISRLVSSLEPIANELPA